MNNSSMMQQYYLCMVSVYLVVKNPRIELFIYNMRISLRVYALSMKETIEVRLNLTYE